MHHRINKINFLGASSHVLLGIGILFFVHCSFGQCPPNSATLTGTYTITSAVSPCSVSGFNFITLTGNIVIQNGASLTITTTGGAFSQFAVEGALTVESGGTLNVNNGWLFVRNSGVLTVNSGGTVNTSSDVYIGNYFGSGSGNLNLDGDMNVSGNFDLQTGGVIAGSGTLDVSGSIVDLESGDDSGWAGSCSGGCSTLPVELVDFNGISKLNQEVELIWNTASETNNKGFFVEKSIDGDAFYEIGFIGGSGTTSEPQEYMFSDYKSICSAYYRLKQVDFDGKFEYHSIIFIEHISEIEISIFPNPAIDEVKLLGPRYAPYRLQVFDLSGSIIFQSKSETLESLNEQINSKLSEWIPSTYILNIEFGKTSRVLKLSKE